MTINEFWTKRFLFGLAAGILIITCSVLLLWLEKRKSKYYDERQLLAQNKAYKYSFFFLLFYNAVCLFLNSSETIKWATPIASLLIGITLTAIIFNVTCIFNDAYIGFNQKAPRYNILFLILGALQTFIFIDEIKMGKSIFTDGLINENIIFLCSVIFPLSIPVAQFAKKHFCKKEDNEE